MTIHLADNKESAQLTGVVNIKWPITCSIVWTD
jgi:hypothetical protein